MGEGGGNLGDLLSVCPLGCYTSEAGRGGTKGLVEEGGGGTVWETVPGHWSNAPSSLLFGEHPTQLLF